MTAHVAEALRVQLTEGSVWQEDASLKVDVEVVLNN